MARPIKGEYKFTDEFAMAEGFEENVEFMKLTYLDPRRCRTGSGVRSGSADALAAGGAARHVDRRWPSGPTRAVIRPPVCCGGSATGCCSIRIAGSDFVAALPDSAGTVFVVTDSAAVFAGGGRAVASRRISTVVRLYENYLTTFAINQWAECREVLNCSTTSVTPHSGA
jgi:adenine-specific DNA-methyltransferase